MVTPDFDAIKKKLSGVFSTMRVMVVDDMPMNLDSYRLILQGLGVQRSNIFSATNGLKAIIVLETPFASMANALR